MENDILVLTLEDTRLIDLDEAGVLTSRHKRDVVRAFKEHKNVVLRTENTVAYVIKGSIHLRTLRELEANWRAMDAVAKTYSDLDRNDSSAISPKVEEEDAGGAVDPFPSTQQMRDALFNPDDLDWGPSVPRRLKGPLVLNGVAPVSTDEEDAAIMRRIPRASIESAGLTYGELYKRAHLRHREDVREFDSVQPDWNKLTTQYRYTYMRLVLSHALREKGEEKQEAAKEVPSGTSQERVLAGAKKLMEDRTAFRQWLVNMVASHHFESKYRACVAMAEGRLDDVSFGERLNVGALLISYGVAPKASVQWENPAGDPVRQSHALRQSYLLLSDWVGGDNNKTFDIHCSPASAHPELFFWEVTICEYAHQWQTKAGGTDILAIVQGLISEYKEKNNG